ncbi:MAG: hypothetical protein MRJ52_04330 [Nitrosomonas sp.]|nr:hypothetical protein [Nitrosomonas sp.]
MKLHDNLGDDGCFAISVEPIPSDDDIEQPSIIFICHKNNKNSHIRAIVRESYEEKKKREENIKQQVAENAKKKR